MPLRNLPAVSAIIFFSVFESFFSRITLARENVSVDNQPLETSIVTNTSKTQPNFFINPILERNENPLINLSGWKKTNSDLFLNGQRIVPLENVDRWSFPYLIFPGENNIMVEERDPEGNITAQAKIKTSYLPLSSTSSPIINLLKERLKEKTQNEVRKALASEERGRAESQNRHLSSEASSDLRQSLKKGEFNYLLTFADSPLTAFLVHEDERYVSEKETGGLQITSSTQPQENSWSNRDEAEFNWKKIEGAHGYKVSFADFPREPTLDLAADKTNYKVLNIPDGIWYFGLKPELGESNLPASFYQIRIETKNPEIVELRTVGGSNNYQNGSLVTINVRMSDHLLSREDLGNLPRGLPVAFLSESNLRNIHSRKAVIPDYQRFVDADFSGLDSDFKRERIMFNRFRNNSDGTTEINFSYRISLDNQRADGADLVVPVDVKNFSGRTTAATVNLNLKNKGSAITLDNKELLDSPLDPSLLTKGGLNFKGKAPANTTLILGFSSVDPVETEVLSGDDGIWTYKLPGQLTTGPHTISARLKGEKSEAAVQLASFFYVDESQKKEITEVSQPLFSSKPAVVDLTQVKINLPPLPTTVKLALVFYVLSFVCLTAALGAWYRENPPRDF